MNAALLSIGDELLIGKTVNTNASWLGEQLSALGFVIHRVETISDDRHDIMTALTRLLDEDDVVLITGGLGPTNDDITKQVLCEFFNTELEFNQQAYDGMARYVKPRHQDINDKNMTQAMFPKAADFLPNPCGTASGMWFEKDGKIVISMPGVPFEMKAITLESVLPRLKEACHLPAVYHRHILVTDITESALAERIADWEAQLPDAIHLAYLPTPGLVKLRMTCIAADEDTAHALVAQEEQKLRPLIEQNIFGYDDETIEQNVGTLLSRFGESISTAESCTGGNIARMITRISGSSAYFRGGIVAYDNAVKIDELQVPAELIATHGVVSEPVVHAMASAVRRKFHTTYGVATSGIAGPTGGSEQKPVGMVCIAVASEKTVRTWTYYFGKDRERNVEKATHAALVQVQRLILEEHHEHI